MSFQSVFLGLTVAFFSMERIYFKTNLKVLSTIS